MPICVLDCLYFPIFSQRVRELWYDDRPDGFVEKVRREVITLANSVGFEALPPEYQKELIFRLGYFLGWAHTEDVERFAAGVAEIIQKVLDTANLVEVDCL